MSIEGIGRHSQSALTGQRKLWLSRIGDFGIRASFLTSLTDFL